MKSEPSGFCPLPHCPPGVGDTFSRMRGIVGYFKRSTNGINDLAIVQAACGDPINKPIQDVATRWRSAYDMANWFRVQQESLTLFDINHRRDADDVYKENRLSLTDWDIVEQSVAVLAGPAEASQLLEGTNYVTSSCVLPYIYRIIHDMKDDSPVYVPWKEQADDKWLEADDLTPAVRAARKLLHIDLTKRWIDELPSEQKAAYAICTLLDPRFKEFTFVGVANGEKEWAVAQLTQAWDASVFKPKPKPVSVTQVQQPVNPVIPTAKAQVTTAHLLSRPILPATVSLSPTEQVMGHEPDDNELLKDLAIPAVGDMNTDVLAWWREWDTAKGLPHLAKFARQWLGTPATSAGVERLFSRAGRMHGDLKAAMADGTLKHCLFAAQNCD